MTPTNVVPLRGTTQQLEVALSSLYRDDRLGLAALEACYPQLEHDDGAAGLVAAALAVTALQTGWSSFESLPRWLSRLRDELVHEPRLPSAWARLRVDCAVVGAAALGYPHGVDEADVARRLSRALDGLLAMAPELPDDEVLTVGRVLLDFIEAHNRAERFEPLMLVLHARAQAGTPLLAGRMWVYASRCYLRFNLQQRNRRYALRRAAACERARELAQVHDLPQLAFDVAHAELFAAVTQGEDARVEQLLDAMESAIERANAAGAEPMRLAEYLMERARDALLKEDVVGALALSADCLNALDRAAAPASQRGPQTLARVWALTAASRIDEALAMLESYAPSTGTGTRTRQVLDCIAALLGALRCRQTGDDEYEARLRDGLSRASQLGWPNFLAALPRQAAVLAADALKHGVHIEFVKGAVVQRRLQPPSRDAVSWPWPVRVITLNGFAIELRGERVDLPAGKVQRKPLELLRMLAVHGNRPVSADLLADRLWPESDGARARAALKVTIGRLRRLLGNEAAVVRSDGRVWLAESEVHVDVERFESACDAIECVTVSTPTASVCELAESVLRVYKRAFLDGEDVNALLLRERHRLHSRFLRAVTSIAELLEARGEVAHAIAVLESASGVDPLDEQLHRRLLRLLRRHGDDGGALRVYAQLRDRLVRELGVMPSPATRDCVRDLVAE